MSEKVDDEYSLEHYKLLVDRYRKAVAESNENFVKQRLLINKLWTKIAELIEDPEDMADFINEVYD